MSEILNTLTPNKRPK